MLVVLALVLALVFVALAGTVVFAIQHFGWSYVSHRFRWRPRPGFRGKTLWDWVQLLLIPLGLVGLAFLLNKWQNDRAQRTSRDSSGQQMLSTYLTQMSGLILDRKLVLVLAKSPNDSKAFVAKSRPSSDVLSIARALTRAAAQPLDPDRKGDIVRFLYDAHLLQFDSADQADPHDVSLVSALANQPGGGIHAGPDFGTANLEEASLEGADLFYADLQNADLRKADLFGANLQNADLQGADLQGADLRAASLLGASLKGTDLARAKCDHAHSKIRATPKDPHDPDKRIDPTQLPHPFSCLAGRDGLGTVHSP
ncbi:MAG: pentapeptide repeat-containing protein [Solirubrobacteraceae bacterium]